MVQIPQVIANRAEPTPRPTAETFGASEARAVGALAGAVNDTGRATAQLFGALNRQRERDALSRSASEILEARDEFEQDGNLEDIESRFETRLGEIRERNAKGLIGGRRFGEQFEYLAERSRVQLRGTVRQKVNSETRAKGRDAADRYAKLAAQARTDDDRELYRVLAISEIDALEGAGAINPEQASSDRKTLDRTITLGELAELERIDPNAALEELSDEHGELTRGLTEQERQQGITRLVRTIETSLRSQLELESKQAAARERDRKEIQRNAQRDFLRRASGDGEGLDLATVEEVGDFLDPEVLERWRGVAINGGRIQVKPLNGARWVQYRRRVRAGDPSVAADIEDDASRGELSESLADSLLTKADEFRFGLARDLLEAGVESAQLSGVPGQDLLAERAVQELELWIEANQDATRAEALAEANAIAERSDVFGIVRDELSRPLPPEYVRVDGKLNFEASRDRITTEETAGRISETRAAELFDDLARREARERRRQAMRQGGNQ